MRCETNQLSCVMPSQSPSTSNNPPIQDAHTSGHSRRLRSALRAARKQQAIPAIEVCRRIGMVMTEYARLRDPLAAPVDPPHVNTLYTWERFERHPGIDSMAAWARVLSMRLIVDLDDAASPRHYVILDHEESVKIARLVDTMKPAARHALLELLDPEG